MLRIDQLYFRNFSIIFFVTLLITAVSGYFLLHKIEIDNHKVMLENMIDQFAIINEEKNSDKIVKAIKQNSHIRVTIIDELGVVTHESDRNAHGMENHLNRPEISEAMQGSVGSSIRYSKSIKTDLLYVAKRVDKRFIRMAYALDSIDEKFLKFWLKAMFFFAISMMVAMFVAFKINKMITKDLGYIKTSLDNLLNKKYDQEFDTVSCCKEFDAISKQVVQVSQKLERRDRQKAKYTKNLKILSKKQSDIISAISHEFKNPIAAIMGYAQTVQEDENLSLNLKEKFLGRVISNANKISNMIDRLAMAIKLENDTFKLEYSEFKILPLIEDTKEMLLQKYTQREIILEVEDVTIKADKSMFEHLLTNLIENALKYSEEEVIVRVKDGLVEVVDSGIGIKSEDIENITKRFYRVETLSWDNSIGIGLYIVKYILKIHGSELKIKSREGVGSTFYFDLV